MSNYGNAKELSTKVLEGMTVYSDLLGPRDESKQGKYGFVPGLDMSAHADALGQQMDKLKEGIFQVLFTGGFNAGKSTLLNALMRRSVLRMSINPETAIITKIVFEKDEKIIIYMKDTDKASGQIVKKEMSLKEFFEDFRVDQDEANKFAQVDYAVLQLSQEGIGGSMVQLVDSPGTQNSDADTKAAREFAKSADAVVYLINGVTPFVQEDKEYISSHYAGKHMQNLFFVINRFDCVDEDDVPDLKRNVREQLNEVFTKQDGSFDEKLFRERVFYTNAYGSLMARTGKKIKVMGMEMAIDDNTTGVPEFEDALGRFLTDGGRDRKAFQAYMPKLAGMYLAAETKIDELMKVYQKKEDELLEEKQKMETSNDQYTVILNGIVDSCRTCVAGILDDASNEYKRCVNRIDSGWNDHFANSRVQLKIRDVVGLAINKVTSSFSRDEAVKQLKMEKHLQPLADAVNDYVKPELEKIGPGVEVSIEKRLNTLQGQLDNYAKQLDMIDSPLSYEDIAKALMSAYNMNPDTIIGGAKVDANLFQIVLGCIAMDPETIALGVSGKQNNTKIIVSTITKTIVEFIAWNVVAWPIGLAMLAGRLYQMIKEGKATRRSTAVEIMQGMRESSINAIKMNEKQFMMDLENQLSVITRGGVTMADGIQTQIDDYVAQVTAAIDALSSNSEAAADEEKRTGKIKAMLLDSLKSLYGLLNGTVLTDEKIKKLAVSE